MTDEKEKTGKEGYEIPEEEFDTVSGGARESLDPELKMRQPKCCPECQSEEITVFGIEAAKLKGITVSFRKYCCNDCGNEWRVLMR